MQSYSKYSIYGLYTNHSEINVAISKVINVYLEDDVATFTEFEKAICSN